MQEKIEDFENGTIYKTASGGFIFTDGKTHAGQFATIEQLKKILGRTTKIQLERKKKKGSK